MQPWGLFLFKNLACILFEYNIQLNICVFVILQLQQSTFFNICILLSIVTILMLQRYPVKLDMIFQML